jgi:hypothetical protein
VSRFDKEFRSSITETVKSATSIVSGILLAFQNQGTIKIDTPFSYELTYGGGVTQY